MRKVINIIVTIVFGFVLFYFFLPAINLSDPSFYVFIGFILLFYGFISTITSVRDLFTKNSSVKFGKSFICVSGGVVCVVGLILLIDLICSPLFQSKSYSKRITIDESKNFYEDVNEVDFNKLPLLDKSSSSKLGDRVMGQMPELVSQFLVSELYTQINYNDEIVRVTPLEYSDIIKYFTNRKDGIPGYITVNSVSGKANLVKLKTGMKYAPSAYFFHNLDRHIRFNYPTKIFDDEYFEVDNKGNPYWIVPTIKYTAVGLRKEIDGAIIVNPINGKMKYYKVKNIPTWVDHVYDAELIIEQVDNWGSYRQGFINSIFGQKGVIQTTDGYNYTVMNDDVYLYTGITSVSNDASNLGFILTNLRTKETHFYEVPGAEEYSAMESAKGQVQQMKYTSTFPLLINLAGRATYVVSLKDNAGLVKMYAFVDVSDYQKVVVTDASLGIEAASEKYLQTVKIDTSSKKTITKDITIDKIIPVVIDSNTIYYITDNEGNKYTASIDIGTNSLPFLNSGDSIKIKYKEKTAVENPVYELMSVE